ncbi:response regulator transcription factor [Pseudonocardia ailaonensis]|uniref:Response regulator transcription factor n=1 Tax=Pseudonocardia ailaonensis TaxID=367279 RepID=A0ABN2MU09_9PSEU
MRVVIGEDETLLREGLTLVLSGAGIEVVGSAGDAVTLLDVVDRTHPDVVVTDIRMPPGRADDGLVAATRIRRTRPGTGVLVLSQFVQRRYALELIGTDPAGVGYLLKERIGEVSRFVADVRQVGSGGTVLDPEVVQAMITTASRTHRDLDRLTPRQREVLELVAQGRSNAAIASRLAIAEKSVVQHVSRIYDELGLETNAGDHRRVLAVVRHLSG